MHKCDVFEQFEPDRVLNFIEDDIDYIVMSVAITRNRAKIVATINNALATVQLRKSGSPTEHIWTFKPAVTSAPLTVVEIPTTPAEPVALSKTLCKHGFAFVACTTLYALMGAVGIIDTRLIDSHRSGSSGV